MKTWRKGSTLLLVGLMIMSGLVAISAPAVVADTSVTGTGDRFAVVFNDALMYDELIYDVDPIDNSYYLLGEGDGVRDNTATANKLRIEIEAVNMFTITNIMVNITGYDNTVFDFEDDDDTEPDWPGTAASPWWNPAGNGTTRTWDWEFDVLKTSGLGYSGDTEVDMRIVYYEGGTKQSKAFSVHIYLSSIFDDPATPNDSPFGVLPMMRETTGGGDDARFEAGDTFTATELEIWNYDDGNIDDVTCTITPPAGTGVTFSRDIDYCTIPNGVPAGASENLTYRTDIAVQTPPDIYEGTAVITYTRDDSDLMITESNHAVEWHVDFSFIDTDPYTPANSADKSWSPFQLQATSVTILNNTKQVDYAAPYDVPIIEQSDYTDEIIRVEIAVHNNGNTDLFNVQFAVIPGADFYPAAGAGWDFFRNPRFFWGNVSAPGGRYDTISETIPFIEIDDTVTLVMEFVVASNIPIGVHRLPLSYDGYYFNGGELGEATGFRGINGGEGFVDGVDDLSVIFSIEVVDQVIACHVVPGATTAGDKANIIAETISVTLVNDEMYTFIDLTVRADFTGTPWYNPIIGMSGEQLVWANEANPSVLLPAWAPGAAGQQTVTFTVDTNPNMTPDTYPFELEITAVIQQTLDVVTMTVDYRQGATIYYAGYGPRIQISAFTTGETDIVPGKAFDLTLTIENVGDDTLRDVFVFIECDDTEEYPWDLEQEFKEQFDWSNIFENMGTQAGATFSWENADFPEDIFYTLEDLDVDNVREIVEINLYMDGVYTSPGARISLIRIIDLAPGTSFDVPYEMLADKDMVNGKPYEIEVNVVGIDSAGVTYDDIYTISVMTSLPGKSYNPVELNWFDAGLKALGLFLFFIIVLAILLFVYNMFKGEPYDEDEDDFDFEDEDEPFEPDEDLDEAPEAEAPEAPEQELVEP